MRASPVSAILSVSLTLPLLPLASTNTRFSGDPIRFRQYVSHNRSLSRPGGLVFEKPGRRWTFCCKCRHRQGNGYAKSEALNEGEDFIVLNFYRFVSIEDPAAEIAKHLSFLKDLNIRGRIYLNEQGINAQISPAINGHAFPKLKLQNKPSLVQYEGGISHLPLLDPPMRAKPLEPSEWKRKLKDLTADDETSPSSSGRSCILLDVRNGYEWDVGHFRGARRPEVDCFRNTSFGLADEKEAPSDPLINVDKEKTDILMYCTGGIRCDVYSTVLRQRGFKNLYTLKGGVSHYLEEEGTADWVGNLFVFDSRLSLPPAAYGNNAVDEAGRTPQTPVDTSFARCYICDSQVQELRHRNCANLDCNRLFLCCAECVIDLKGCCCSNCITAPRLRPVLHGLKRYEKWHVYRDS
ncbi:rhodanese-like domain-containing protein 8, chloroplastic isoform X2 [Eutrema salsugineum]|uniref:rhodanese-like domain-containing protein 8, chloroplastic isoform X2 n=1 Tax=Eutrema salsugineum TaxID=72664 RepID=UPI000CECF6E2|nr:rhodanese-like domain-containing protein 8, chloroplastic isoform X2 [Eutrema salsugineum]